MSEKPWAEVLLQRAVLRMTHAPVRILVLLGNSHQSYLAIAVPKRGFRPHQAAHRDFSQRLWIERLRAGRAKYDKVGNSPQGRGLAPRSMGFHRQVGQQVDVLPSLSRFESGRAQPSFGDVCVIAQDLGWPLLYFATGRERRADDTRALAIELHFWGLRDIRLGKRVLLREVRAFEESLADAVAGFVDARVLEALPALLLRNRFEPQELIVQRTGYGGCGRHRRADRSLARG